MNRSDILVPLNLEKDSLEGLKYAAQVAGEIPLHTTLLNVVELNVFPLDRRVYDEICLECQEKLRQFADGFREDHIRVCVRIGKPHEQILAEARESGVEVIVMGAPRNHHRRWPFRSTNVERVVRDAPCLTLVMSEPWKSAAPRHGLPVSLFARNHPELMPH